MTADGHFEVPRPINEPVRQYPPGDSHRKSLKGRLAELTDARTEIPMTIGGEHRAGNGKGDLRAPHRKELSIGRYAVGVVKDFDDAINSALKARRMWAATAYHERAAVMLRAASLLAGPWRDTINAATMLGQSKTVHQAEIDAACESIDFWRFNAYFGDQLLRQQPYNDATAWNRFEYRPLEGFVFAVSPFNFTSIGANLPTAPMLMGNTVVFKPATQTLLASHFLMELFAEAGLPPGVINMVSGSASEISDRVLHHPQLKAFRLERFVHVERGLEVQLVENDVAAAVWKVHAHHHDVLAVGGVLDEGDLGRFGADERGESLFQIGELRLAEIRAPFATALRPERGMLLERSLHPQFVSNTYLVAAEPGGEAALIDAGGPLEPLYEAVDRHGLTVTHLLLTHHHHDHVEQATAIKDRYGAEVIAHRLEAELLEGVDRTIEPGDVVEAGGVRFEALHTPGHTAGMTSFRTPDAVFTGDTLFKGSVGGVRAALVCWCRSR